MVPEPEIVIVLFLVKKVLSVVYRIWIPLDLVFFFHFKKAFLENTFFIEEIAGLESL